MVKKGDFISDITIPVADLAKVWLKDSEFRAEYDALEDEFALVSASIEAGQQGAESIDAHSASPFPPKAARPSLPKRSDSP